MPRRICAPPGRRTAIRLDERTLLAVPRMHPDTPSEVRVQVFELLLRRLPFEAAEVAQVANHAGSGTFDSVAALVAEKPYGSGRGTAA